MEKQKDLKKPKFFKEPVTRFFASDFVSPSTRPAPNMPTTMRDFVLEAIDWLDYDQEGLVDPPTCPIYRNMGKRHKLRPFLRILCLLQVEYIFNQPICVCCHEPFYPDSPVVLSHNFGHCWEDDPRAPSFDYQWRLLIENRQWSWQEMLDWNRYFSVVHESCNGRLKSYYDDNILNAMRDIGGNREAQDFNVACRQIASRDNFAIDRDFWAYYM